MIILDTCALLWLVDDPSRLSPTAVEALRAHCGLAAVLPISAWEIATKVRQGGIALGSGMSAEDWYAAAVAEYGLFEITLDAGLLCLSVTLPRVHRDPCDRMIIAAAVQRQLPVITADQTFKQYPNLNVIW